MFWPKFIVDTERIYFQPNFYHRPMINKLCPVLAMGWFFIRISIEDTILKRMMVVSLVMGEQLLTKFVLCLKHQISFFPVQVGQTELNSNIIDQSLNILDDRTVRLFDLRTKSKCLNQYCQSDILVRTHHGITSIDVNPRSPTQIVCACSDGVCFLKWFVSLMSSCFSIDL